MSLDHDLGACDECLGGRTPLQWFVEVGQAEYMPHCRHIGTGYDFVCWLEETGYWPVHKPVVHSMNPVGARKMRLAIDSAWRRLIAEGKRDE